jgi:hypothetical protein
MNLGPELRVRAPVREPQGGNLESCSIDQEHVEERRGWERQVSVRSIWVRSFLPMKEDGYEKIE